MRLVWCVLLACLLVAPGLCADGDGSDAATPPAEPVADEGARKMHELFTKDKLTELGGKLLTAELNDDPLVTLQRREHPYTDEIEIHDITQPRYWDDFGFIGLIFDVLRFVSRGLRVIINTDSEDLNFSLDKGPWMWLFACLIISFRLLVPDPPLYDSPVQHSEIY